MLISSSCDLSNAKKLKHFLQFEEFWHSGFSYKDQETRHLIALSFSKEQISLAEEGFEGCSWMVELLTTPKRTFYIQPSNLLLRQ